MQAIFPINVMNKASATSADWLLYTWKDWLLMSLSVVILLAYEGVFLFIYHVSPHHCTLHRNINARKYVLGSDQALIVEILTV
mgnify:CR=1 FL=1